jgi:peptide/nickel transport system substrate-binding protein
MANNYWSELTRRRLGRRRAIAGGAGLGLGALALSLVGCGGGGGNGGGLPGDKSGLIYKPIDTQASAKPGGTYKHFSAGDITHFDPSISDSSQTNGLSGTPFYPTLVKFKHGKFPDEADGTSVGEYADSWEISPDKLQVTFRIRQGMKWDARAPTNGRQVDSQDALFTWSKYIQANPGRGSIVYDATNAPGSAIETLTAPDARTLVAKLKNPDASLLALLSTRFFVMPKESESAFDPRTTARGHGPFVLEEYVPSSRFVWRKNPDYYVKDRPFFDRVEVPIVTEQATRLAQFKAGNIYSDVLTGSQQDIVPTKRDHPELLMVQADRFNHQGAWMMTFSWEEGSPFRDTRMRQAVSMLVDREAYVDVIDNRDNFRRDGIEIPYRINSVIPGGWGDYWLDPTSKDFGSNAKYLSFDQAEAKKLMAAAGFANGVEVDFNFLSTGQFGAVYNRVAEIYAGMLREGGFRLRMNGMEFNNWVDNISQGYRAAPYKAGQKKGFLGIGMQGERGYPTAAVLAYNQFNTAGQGYRGMTPDGRNVADGDPKCQDLTLKINAEYDTKKQIALVHELTRYATGMAYYIPQASAAKAFSLWWPAVSNIGAETAYPGTNIWQTRANWWIDTTKPPLGRA